MGWGAPGTPPDRLSFQAVGDFPAILCQFLHDRLVQCLVLLRRAIRRHMHAQFLSQLLARIQTDSRSSSFSRSTIDVRQFRRRPSVPPCPTGPAQHPPTVLPARHWLARTRPPWMQPGSAQPGPMQPGPMQPGSMQLRPAHWPPPGSQAPTPRTPQPRPREKSCP